MEVSALRYSGGIGLHGRSPLLRLQSDERLISLVRRGNSSAFEVLVARYHSRLLAFCRHLLGSKEDAEDVLQEVFAAAFNAMLADERPINVRPWLYRIARNRSLNHLRRIQAIGVDSMDVHFSEYGTTTADKVHDREKFRLLVRDIQSLPETQRTALVLREMDALSYDQIAEAMDTTVPGVKSLLVRARISLAEAAEARQLSCAEVRIELAEVAEGLHKRPPTLVRRHLRTCNRCATFQSQLKQTNKALAALLPIGPVAVLRQLLLAHVGHSAGTGTGATAASAGAGSAGAAGATTGASATGLAAGQAAAVAGTASSGAAFGSAGSLLSASAGALATKAAAGLAAAAIVTAGAVEVTHVVPKAASGAAAGQAGTHATNTTAQTAHLDLGKAQSNASVQDKPKTKTVHPAKTADASTHTQLALTAAGSSTASQQATDTASTKPAADQSQTPKIDSGRTQIQTDSTVLNTSGSSSAAGGSGQATDTSPGASASGSATSSGGSATSATGPATSSGGSTVSSGASSTAGTSSTGSGSTVSGSAGVTCGSGPASGSPPVSSGSATASSPPASTSTDQTTIDPSGDPGSGQPPAASCLTPSPAPSPPPAS